MAYRPNFPSTVADLDQLKIWVLEQLELVAKELPDVPLQLKVSFVAPVRPRDGQIVYADGTEWNPGFGEGFYGYLNGAWVKFT